MTVVDRRRLGLSERQGTLLLTEFALGNGSHAQCLVKRTDNFNLLKRTLETLAASDAPTSKAAQRVRIASVQDTLGAYRNRLMSAWIRSRLAAIVTGNAAASISRATLIQEPVVALSVAEQAPYRYGPRGALVVYIPAPTYIIVDLMQLAYELRDKAPTSLSAYFPSDAEIAFMNLCDRANELAAELDTDSQMFRSLYDEEMAAFGETGGLQTQCEIILNTPGEKCVDIFIRERRIGLVGLGDFRPPNPAAPRSQSRVQMNFDPDAMRLNVFVNHSDILLSGYLIRFGPNNGVTYELPSSTPVTPSTIQKISFERVNGDPNVVRLAYSFTNNVCSYVNAQPPLCPAIDGDLVWRKTGNRWILDMQESVMDLYPFKQINELDDATQTFRPIVTLPNLMDPITGLTHSLTISMQLAMDMARMFRLPGCLQE